MANSNLAYKEEPEALPIFQKIVSVSLNKLAPKEQAPEEVILDSVKLPDDSPARMKVLRSEGRKWYLTVVYHKSTEQPFALFCHTNSPEKSASTSDAVERMLGLARRKKIPEDYVRDVEKKIHHESNTTKLTRVISLLLRHGVLIKNIVAELNRMEDIYVNSFLFQLKKFLSNYIMDGEVADDQECEECGGKIIYSGGCFMCSSCGSSKCS